MGNRISIGIDGDPGNRASTYSIIVALDGHYIMDADPGNGRS